MPTMKITWLALIGANLSAIANAIDFTVASCDDLASVDDNTVTSLTITTNPFKCEEYTRFRVRNSMVLQATSPEVVFSNFALKVTGNLTVEPDVVFVDVFEQVSWCKMYFSRVGVLRAVRSGIKHP